VILIGMHRSGTSLLARMLGDLGLFIGARRDENDEAFFFQELNEWALRSAGGSWERPHAIHTLLANAELRRLTVEYLDGMLRSPRAASYLGVTRALRHRTPRALPGAWGFKDPRATFTLPLWLDLFPNAPVIHVRRHGVDVAASLRVRQERALAGARAVHERRRALYWLRPKRGGFAHTVRALSLEGGFGLWEEYTAEADAHLARLGDQALDLVYEELLADPVPHLARAAAHAGLAPTDADLARATADVRPTRAQAWASDPELVAFAATVADRLGARGYAAAAPGSAAGSGRA
jgi:hypothetical protein